MLTKATAEALMTSWGPVEAVCHRLCARAGEFAPRFANLIRDQLPEYSEVPWDEHVGHVREQCVSVLQAVAERRAPNDADMELARQLGMRRASQDLNLQTVIGAFQLGNRELWNMIRADPVGLEQLLPEVGTIMWDAILVVTGALADAHAEVSRALQADRVTLENRFLELLGSEASHANELLQIASVLGFDPAGTFQAAAANAVEVDPEGFGLRARGLARIEGVFVYAARANRLVVVGQGVRTDRLIGLFGRSERSGPVRAGVGLARSGLTGAARSVHDASLALSTSTHAGQIARFEKTWLRSLVMAHAETLIELVKPKLPIVLANPTLSETVEVFAQHDLSVPRTAEALHLHPNSVLYRLNRWEALTGWDPRSFEGLTHSLLACWTGNE